MFQQLPVICFEFRFSQTVNLNYICGHEVQPAKSRASQAYFVLDNKPFVLLPNFDPINKNIKTVQSQWECKCVYMNKAIHLNWRFTLIKTFSILSVWCDGWDYGIHRRKIDIDTLNCISFEFCSNYLAF